MLPLKIIAKPGFSPPFWPDRNAIFFPNLLSMFFGNQAEVRALEQTVGGVKSHGARLAPILNLLFKGSTEENTLILESAPDLGLFRYFEHDLGLSLPKYDVLPHAIYERLEQEQEWLDRLRNLNASYIDGYVTDRTLESVGRATEKTTVSTYEGSWRGNNKALLYQFLTESGLPVFDTKLVASVDGIEASLAELRRQGYAQAVIKSPIGASGVGMQKESTFLAQFRAPWVPNYFFHEGPVLVQGWLDDSVDGVSNVRSPSIQIFINETEAHLFDITEQFLSAQSVHQGNESPPPYINETGYEAVKEELLRQAALTAEWLHTQGYRGTASVDFLVLDRGDATEVYVCEVNARVTGATYPSMLALHFLPQGAWVMQNVKFLQEISSEALLTLLDHSDHLYHPGKEIGVLPYNLYTCPQREHLEKAQLVCLGPNVRACEDWLRAAEHQLPVDWERGRD
jgi:hypothetical protein